MAQLAFVKFEDISQEGPTGVPNITFVFKVIWVGDELAGADEVRITTTRATTNNALANAVQSAVIARAAALGRPGLAVADIRLVGGTVF